MERAIRYFSSDGYEVEDVHSGAPYDLKCTKRRELIFVEVKGTTGDGKNILLTSGEVNFARNHPSWMALFVVHSIRLGDNEGSDNGIEAIVKPWKLDSRKLTPYGFFYRL